MAPFRILLAALALMLATNAPGARQCREFERKTGTSSSAPHVERGNLIEQRYRRLQAHYESLSRALRAYAPSANALGELLQSRAEGYQRLPKIIPDTAFAERSPRVRSFSYGWPLTERLLDLALEETARFEVALKNAAALGAAAKNDAYERLARSYQDLGERQNNIGEHIRYNRLWQAAVAADRPGYDRWTLLHDAVLEREAIRDILAASHGNFGKKIMALWRGIQTAPRLSETTRSLIGRERLLSAMIESASESITLPSFVKIERRSASWIFHVPLYTDIDDRDFVQSVKKKVEDIWRLRRGAEEFRLELTPAYIPAHRFYAKTPPPPTGQWIDLERHLAVFPDDGAVLTTGGVATHVYGRGVILGPHEVSARVLAHEFGHILGFPDKYFRGYRDLGSQGFEVIEVAVASDDIMASPGTGAVRYQQFMLLLEELLKAHPLRS